MSGIFNFFDYNSPGPGVPKDEPAKPRIIVFIQIYLRKFWNLVKVNALFFFFNIPALVLVIFSFVIFLGFQGNLAQGTFMRSMIFLSFSSFFMSVPVITSGPAQAGFTYILRNYSMQKHAFIWSDFIEYTKNNFKQAILISAIDIFALLFVFVDIYLYTISSMNGFFISIFAYFISLLLIIFLMMHLYIYPMLVTFKLSLKQIYKNAFLLALLKFLPNIGILFVCFVISAMPFFIIPAAAIILFPIITLSTVGLITNFYVYPILEKFMIKVVSKKT
ncbi:MAG: DUF624 domain-containing protein [Bacillota bacterium]|nr:DUF624 domain-containing protein [Bacillota bacterium]